jgi:hypothetical protein
MTCIKLARLPSPLSEAQGKRRASFHGRQMCRETMISLLCGRYTVKFWWKALEGTSWDSINKGQMIAFSSFVPPRVLFALDFYGNTEKLNYWVEAYDTCNFSLENLNNIDGGEKFEPGNWYFVAIVVGSPSLEVEGRRSMFVMSGFQPGADMK